MVKQIKQKEFVRFATSKVNFKVVLRHCSESITTVQEIIRAT